MSEFNPVEDILAAVRAGGMVVVLDDEHRENEGDLVMAADRATPAAVNFMITHARGLLCAPLTAARARALGLTPMASTQDRYGTAFTVSVDARDGVATGISAPDRAHTLQLLADPAAGHEAFDVPGHVFPLVAREGGVLERPGHTEAAVDLARLAGRQPAGVICEIMNADGTMARAAELDAFRRAHRLLWCRISDLVRYRQQREPLVDKSGSVKLPSHHGPEEFELHCYVSRYDGKEHIGLVYGDVAGRQDVLVRVHSECLTGDVFHSARCDCGEQLAIAMQRVVKAGRGVIVYLRQEGRGIGLINKIKAYELQDQGLDTVEANVRLGFAPDLRDYSVAAHILNDLGVKSIRLLTNNPAKISGLRQFGIRIAKRVPLVAPPRATNARYLRTKKERLGHLL